jgi:uncharacterized protein (TIGR02246 family)
MTSHLRACVALVLAAALSACAQQPGAEATQAVEALRVEVAELASREAIRELFTDYGRALDDRDFARFATLFARDAAFVGGGEAHGPQAIAEFLESQISRNASGANLHVFSNEKIDVDGDADRASATSRGAFVGQDANGRPTAIIYATYIDTLAREDGRWKFLRREIVADIPGPPNDAR